MAGSLKLHPSIPDDLLDAMSYYDDISLEIGDRFREEVDGIFDLIAERPNSFPVDVPPVRFAKLRRFPYVVFFVPKSTFVSIMAVVHGSTDPATWRQREV
ncbi:type II toxin-antitoxin system RelE/ParE family toxin [Pirellulales bacterium]|nr:type II toxin-antitoxin system RelE/ParE family toxin [Pirellulales bacterium]